MSSATRTVILHIGTGKTGTTAIQAYLRSAREELLARGFCYPQTFGSKHHGHLIAVMDPSARRWKDIVENSDAPGPGGIAASIAEELASLPDTVHGVIFSSEMLYGHSLDSDGPRRLRDFLAPHAASFRIIVYLRRQDEKAVSGYSTGLKGGRDLEDPLMPREGKLDALDYARFLRPWAEAFGREAIIVRIFDRAELVGGDVITDFLEAAGIGPLATPRKEGVQNPSLAAPALEFLRRINAINIAAREGGGEGGTASSKPSRLRALLTKGFPGASLLPARSRAEAFYARFRDSNAEVLQRYLPERERLFREDFSRYPETEGKPSDAEVLRVAERVVLELLREAERQTATRSLQQAAAAAREGDLTRAATQYARAVNAGAADDAMADLAALELDRADKAWLIRRVGPKVPHRERQRLEAVLAPDRATGPRGEWKRRRKAAAQQAVQPEPEKARRRDKARLRKAEAEAPAAAEQPAAPKREGRDAGAARKQARRAARRASETNAAVAAALPDPAGSPEAQGEAARIQRRTEREAGSPDRPGQQDKLRARDDRRQERQARRNEARRGASAAAPARHADG